MLTRGQRNRSVYQEEEELESSEDNPNVKFISYEIMGFGQDAKEDRYGCHIEEFAHAVIRFEGEDGYIYMFETGNLTNPMTVRKIPIYPRGTSYQELQNWKGCTIAQGKIRKRVTLGDIINASENWKKYCVGRSTTYPYNCRGYVDYIVRDVLNKPTIDWRPYLY